MEAMAVIQYNSGVPGYNFHVTGDLGLVQKQLLNTRGRDLRYNQSVFVVDEDSSVEFNFNRIIKNYSKRNSKFFFSKIIFTIKVESLS